MHARPFRGRLGRVWLGWGSERGQRPESDRLQPHRGHRKHRQQHPYRNAGQERDPALPDPNSDRVDADEVGDDRGRSNDSDHHEHGTAPDEDRNSDPDRHVATEDNHGDHAHTDDHGRQNGDHHRPDHDDHDVDKPRSRRGGRRRRRGKERTILRIERTGRVGLGADRRRHRRCRDLDYQPDSARSKEQLTERRDGRPGSVERRAAAAQRAASSMSDPDSLAVV